MGIGINECRALSTLLCCASTQLKRLDLCDNNIDDEGMEVLVNGLTNINTLQELNLSTNRSITIKGWKEVATLLEMSKLKALHIEDSDIGDEEARVFANALVNNSTLEELDLCYNSITVKGWASFSKLLCNTSSVNKTYLSNHTLQYIMGCDVSNVRKGLDLNKNLPGRRKPHIAMVKILRTHSHFNMEPFFEWEFKVLPLLINWFKKAFLRTSGFSPSGFAPKMRKMKLSAVYDFVKEFPMLYIEPVTRKEIAEYIALEEELKSRDLMGVEQEARLEEIRQCKARAMGRLVR